MGEHPADVAVERPAPATAVVVLSGEHDLSERAELSALLLGLVEENELVVVDFTDATFVDSTTLHVLVGAHMDAQRRGTRFRLQLGTTSIVARAFELSGLDRRLDVARTREEALAEPDRDV